MKGKITNAVSKYDKKREDSMKSKIIYKDAALNAIEDATKFDTKIISSNDEYLGTLQQADSIEYDILKDVYKRQDSEGMLISAVYENDGREGLNLLMLDSGIPAGAKLY